MAEDTQTTTVSVDSEGNAFDTEGNRVDLEKLGISVQTVRTVPETQMDDDDCTQDINAIVSSISVTQASGLPDIPSDDSIMEAAMAEDNTNDTQDEARNFASGSVITVPSCESNPKKHQLLSKETESDFLEDHLVELLDAGNLLSVMCHD